MLCRSLLYVLLAVSTLSAVPSLTTDKTSYLVLEKINVTFSGPPGNARDWITVVPASAPDTTGGAYQYTNGATSGRFVFDAGDPGTYEARLYFNNTYTVEARVRFTVAFPVPTVTTDKSAYLVLEQIAATYSNMPGYPQDYLTIVPKGTPDNVYGAFTFTNAAKSGRILFEPVEPGNWEVRALFRNENGPVHARASLTVSFPVPLIATNKTQYGTTEKITVTYSNMPGYTKDYVTLVPVGTPDSTYGVYQFTTGKSGSLVFDALPVGQYEARALFRNENGPVRSRVPFSVRAASCTTTLSPSTASLPAAGGTGSLTITASASDCSWTATSSASWLTLAPSSGQGTANLTYSAASHTAAISRTATITVGGQVFTLTQAATAPPCTFSISPASATVSAVGGTGSIAITASANTCGWTAITTAQWLTLSASSGQGSSTLVYTATANTTAATRSTTISIGGQLFTLSQPAPAPPQGGNLIRNPGAEEGPATSDYNGQPNIPGWQADGKATVYPYNGAGGFISPTDPGPTDRGNNFFGGGYANQSALSQTIDLTSSATAIDAGSQNYEILAWLGGWSTQDDNAQLRAIFRDASNAELSTIQLGPVLAAERSSATGLIRKSRTGVIPARARTVDIVLAFTRTEGSALDGFADNLSFTLSASTCAYSLAPASGSVPAAGGSGTTSLTTGTTCAWTATTTDSWIRITSPASGTGPATLQFTAAANTTSSLRRGAITVGGQSFNLSQESPAATCAYSLSPAWNSFGAEGGSGTISLVTSAGCAWTATAGANWIVFSAAASGTGNGSVAYSVAANLTTTARSSEVKVAGQSHAVAQSAGTTSSLAPAIDSTSVVNLTDGSSAFAPGSLVMIGGARLAESTANAGPGPLPRVLAGTSVEVENGGQIYPAPILSVSPTPIVVQIPYEATASTIRIRVRNAAGNSDWVSLALLPRAPRAMTIPGSDPKKAQSSHLTGLPLSSESPARPGETIQLLLTGLGITEPAAISGEGAPDAKQLSVRGVSVRFGSGDAQVLSAQLGATPGVYVVTLVTPWNVLAGDYPVLVTAGAQSSQSAVVVPAGAADAVLSSNWNPAACSTTGLARFHLNFDTFLTRIVAWYRWGDNETTVPFTLGGAAATANGELKRGSCDPYQPNWCEGETRIAKNYPPGDYELRTTRAQLCANAQSSDNGMVKVYGVLNWASPATGIIDAKGGTIQATGFRLNIPAAVLTRPVEYRVSQLPGPFYRLEGLPADGMRGATLEIDVTPDMTASGKLIAVVKAEEETDRGPMFLPVTVNGAKGLITFPNPPLPASGGPRSATPNRNYLVDPNRITSRIGLLKNTSEELSDGGHFTIHFPASDVNDPYMDQKQVSKFLEDAYSKLSEVIDTSRRTLKVDAYVFSYAGYEGQVQGFNPDHAGASETNIWGANFLGLTLNRDMVVDPFQKEQVRITAGHELFHVFQSLWDPRPWPFSVLHSEWLWFQEASATWFEKKMSSSPSTFTPENTSNYRSFLLERGLEFMPSQYTTLDGTSFARHGYGAAAFLQYLYPVGYGERSLGEIVDMMGERSGTIASTWKYSPVEAIRSKDPSVLPLKWRDFIVDYLLGKIYPNINLGAIDTPGPQASAPPEKKKYIFLTDADGGPGPDLWNAPDLSAKLYSFEFRNKTTTWKDAILYANLEDPTGDAEMLVFRLDGLKPVLLGRSQGEFAIKNVETFATSGNTLYIVIANGHAAVPFTAKTPIKLTVSFRPDITRTRQILVAVYGDMIDNFGKLSPEIKYAPSCELTWSGLSFQQSCLWEEKVGPAVRKLVHSATGTVSNDGQVLKELTCGQSWSEKITSVDPAGNTITSSNDSTSQIVIRGLTPLKITDNAFFNFGGLDPAYAPAVITATITEIDVSGGVTTRTEVRPRKITGVDVQFWTPGK